MGPPASTVADYYTDNAYVSPVTITATAGAPISVADGTTQALGSVTLTELANDSLINGVHHVCFYNVTLGTAPLTVAITGGTTPTGSAVRDTPYTNCSR